MLENSWKIGILSLKRPETIKIRKNPFFIWILEKILENFFFFSTNPKKIFFRKIDFSRFLAKKFLKNELLLIFSIKTPKKPPIFAGIVRIEVVRNLEILEEKENLISHYSEFLSWKSAFSSEKSRRTGEIDPKMTFFRHFQSEIPEFSIFTKKKIRFLAVRDKSHRVCHFNPVDVFRFGPSVIPYKIKDRLIGREKKIAPVSKKTWKIWNFKLKIEFSAKFQA